MRHRATHASTSSLFLIELILSAGFLALTAAVCVQLYYHAHAISEESSAVTHAVNEAQNMAESYLAGDGTLGDGILLYLETVHAADTSAADTSAEDATTEDSSALVNASDSSLSSESTTAEFGYDGDWNLISHAAAESFVYTMTVTLEEDPETADVLLLYICVRAGADESDDILFELETARYLPSGEEGAS